MPLVESLGIVHLGVFCAAVMLLNLTPGPDTAFIVGQSVAHGRRAGLSAVLGISAGCLVHTAALALGLSALVAASAVAFTVIKIAGACYLVYLGARMILGSRSANEPAPDVPAPSHATSRRPFAQGFLTNLSNPKVILFFLSFFPQFVERTSPAKGMAFVVLGLVLVAMSTIYNGLVAWLAGGISRRVRGVPSLKRWLDRSIGAAFIALGARLALIDR